MILESLEIKMQQWGDNKGKYEGKAKFASEHGTVEVRISDGHAHRILSICSDAIVNEADKIAKAMIAPLIELPPPDFVRMK